MNSKLTLKDIIIKYRKKVYSQTYAQSTLLEGVKVHPIQNIPSEEGDFSEVIRFQKGEASLIPGFNVAQMNRTRLLPGSIKAWHLHFQQDYIWYISPFSHLIVGLWDLRKKSKTKGKTMRMVMGSGKSQLLYIPHGVAQGSMVVSRKPVDLYVFTNLPFDLKNLDEHRLPWDSIGSDFWKSKRD